MLNVYVAAPWVYKETAKSFAQTLEDEGFTVTSRWHSKHIEGPDSNKTFKMLQTEAQDDVEDILGADALVVLQLEKSEGKAWEQGYYMALYDLGERDVPVIAVCPENFGNIFQRLPEYVITKTEEEAIAALKACARRR